MLEQAQTNLSLQPSTCFLQGSGFRYGAATTVGSFDFFKGSRELLTKIFIINPIFYILHMQPLFIAAKMIGSHGKNDSLLFHSKLF